MLSRDLEQLKYDLYDIIKEREASELFKYDQLIEIFFYSGDDQEFRKWIKLKEDFLRQLQIEANQIYLGCVGEINGLHERFLQ